ncbi:hypothetical protein WR25_26662 [Diploscapter pachys]|uniref:Uncharacterized protein n=1 Tax=Diploscapter pachys TaxID=2018661 RepID=A0A2A2KHJ1_9BILA|nr:hypothetical protein WR25_26662 [Diploscapter pachys]
MLEVAGSRAGQRQEQKEAKQLAQKGDSAHSRDGKGVATKEKGEGEKKKGTSWQWKPPESSGEGMRGDGMQAELKTIIQGDRGMEG